MSANLVKNKVIYAKDGLAYKLIYAPKNLPMRIIVFASGSGGNAKAAIDLSYKNPSLLKVGLIVTDRFGIKAIDIAKENKIQVISADFEKECGIWKECKNNTQKLKLYQQAAINFHSRILKQIIDIEKSVGEPFDLVVFSYHRWVHGNLLDYFKGRIINQHAGDLTMMKEDNYRVRKYIGINPVFMALKAGEKRTRTSTFLVGESHDGGEILCQGPWVNYNGESFIVKEVAWQHELIQKRKSDWPSLRFALKEIAQGHFGIALNHYHPDGCRIVVFKGRPLPYGGVDLSRN